MAGPAIIVHGGAASWAVGGDGDARRRAALAGCTRAAQLGAAVLAAGGAALDAVEAAVRALEDDEAFNAGYGAVLNAVGDVEHDALVVDGRLRAGAVGALPGFANPISVARRVLERGAHVLLVGEGARGFARGEGFAEAPAGALVSPRARRRWEARAAGGAADTVGACAVDSRGAVAAATSTGGTAHKLPGRVGDSPIVGAGAFADDRLGAVSATGHGESILRVGLSRTVAERVRAGDALDAACRFALAEMLDRTDGTGGLIAVDPTGRVAHATSTPQMPWAAIAGGAATGGIDP